MTRQGVSDKENGIGQGAKTFWRLLSLAAVMSWVAGCGGGHASQPVTMVSITVTPTNASIQASATQQFTATGVFSDSSTEDMTKSVGWTSSNTSKATIQNSGLATGVAGGSVTITAASAGKTGTATLTISAPPTLTSVDISPLNPTIAANGTQQFFANASYSDNTLQDVTQKCDLDNLESECSNDSECRSTGTQVRRARLYSSRSEGPPPWTSLRFS